MADRYWRGGSGTWNAANTANWSATSGGAGGASAPTTADNVFFNSASNATAYTVTMGTGAVCADMTMAGPASGNVTWAGITALTIAGSMTVAATGITRTYTGTITFTATTTGKTITVGPTLASNIIFNGVGGGWTLGSALTTTVSVTITAGTLDTSVANNYALSCSNIGASSASTSQLNLNASTINVTFSITMTGSGFTLNAGTSQINLTDTSGSSLSTSSRTFYNVSFAAPSTTNSSTTISGTNAFNNLTIASVTGQGAYYITLTGNQTVNGTFSGSGASVGRRLFYRSSTIGTPVSLILANPVTLSNCDFRDITAVTNAITATGGGDCGGNTNITFPAAKTVYWNLAGNQGWGATGWATSSGGTPNVNNFPLAQDTAIFDNASTVTGTITLAGGWNVGTLNMSGRTTAMTLTSGPAVQEVYGSFLNGTGVTITGTGTFSFSGRGNTQQLSGNGVSFTQDLRLQNIGGTLQLTSGVTSGSTRTFTHTYGTLDLQSYTLTVGLFSGSNSNTRTLAFGTGNITVNGIGTVWTTSNTTNLTVTGAPVVNVSNATATATTVSSGSLTEANSISFNFTTGTYVLTLTGSIRNLNFTGFAGTVSNNAQPIYGDLNLGLTATFTAGASTWTFASTSGTPRTITTNGKTIDFPLVFNGVGGTWVLQDALTMGSTRILTQTNGTLNLNGKTLTVGSSYTTAGGTKNLTFNGGTLICPASSTTAFNNANKSGYTTTAGAGSGTISMTGGAAKTFFGGDATIYNCTINQGGVGALTIVGTITFDNITNTVQPATVRFTAGTTTTFNNFNLRGTSGNLITISSATAATHTLSKASGTVSCDYLSITNSIATGGASWYAGANSTNVSGNTGWIFTAPPSPNSNFLIFFNGP